MDSKELRLQTGSTLVTDVTGEVQDFCQDKGDGLLSVFVPHATAGVALIETGSGSESDLADAIDGCCRGTRATGTGTDRPDTAATTCCRPSSRRRSRCRCSVACRSSAPGRAWCWSTATWTTRCVPYG